MNPDRSVCAEGGRKPFYDVLLATERRCCACASLPRRAEPQIRCGCDVHISGGRRMPYRTERAPLFSSGGLV